MRCKNPIVCMASASSTLACDHAERLAETRWFRTDLERYSDGMYRESASLSRRLIPGSLEASRARICALKCSELARQAHRMSKWHLLLSRPISHNSAQRRSRSAACGWLKPVNAFAASLCAASSRCARLFNWASFAAALKVIASARLIGAPKRNTHSHCCRLSRAKRFQSAALLLSDFRSPSRPDQDAALSSCRTERYWSTCVVKSCSTSASHRADS